MTFCYFDYLQIRNGIDSIKSQTNVYDSIVLYLPLRCWIQHLKQEANFFWLRIKNCYNAVNYCSSKIRATCVLSLVF
jgi:hypothetical protein